MTPCSRKIVEKANTDVVKRKKQRKDIIYTSRLPFPFSLSLCHLQLQLGQEAGEGKVVEDDLQSKAPPSKV